MTRPATVSVLFVDDKEGNYQSVRQSLERKFRKLNCTARIEYEADPDAAHDRITSRRYDVVIADLLFAPPDRPGIPVREQVVRGFDVIESAREVSEDTVVVAITSGDPDRPEIEAGALQRRADLAYPRRSLAPDSPSGGIEQLVNKIYRLLCDRGVVEIGPEMVVEDEPGIQHALYEIGETNIRLLLSDLLSPAANVPDLVELAYVTPGASGAHVLRVRTAQAGEPSRRLLIKVSRDHEALKREAANSQRMLGLYGTNLVVQYAPMEPSARPRNGWYAIMMVFADDAIPLRRWLSDASCAAHVESVLRQLFLGRGLASHYKPRPVTGVRPINRLTLPTFRRVLVRTAAQQLAPVLGHPDGGNVDDAAEVLRVVEAFARGGHIGSVPCSDTPGVAEEVTAHGDLHGANVLVCTDEVIRPLIVDFGAFGTHHWAADPARLMVDMVLRSLDSTVESYLWRRLPAWREIMRAAGRLDGTVADAVPENAAVVSALRWMATERDRLLRPLSAADRWWEWHVALAEQLLRGAYQPDLTPSKRVLALVAAYDQLLTAQRAMPPRSPTF